MKIKQQPQATLEMKTDDVEHVEGDTLDNDPIFNMEEQKNIKYRIDRRLITMTGCMYMIAILDRSNLGNAAIAGMSKDLDLGVGYRYVSAVSSGMEQNANHIVAHRPGPLYHLRHISTSCDYIDPEARTPLLFEFYLFVLGYCHGKILEPWEVSS